jgi:hypothetical protein
MTEIMFGQFGAGFAQGQSILNSDETIYGSYANSTIFSLDFRGLGLPTNTYYKFVNMLNVATNG